MNWEEIGAIGQVLGSIAVFVTVAYLAVQVRHGRQDARRALSQGRGESARDLYTQQSDERINHLYVKVQAALGAPPNPFESALMNQTGLTREEATLMFWIQYEWWNHRLQIIPNVDELPPMERALFDTGVRATLAGPGIFRLFHETMGSRTHPDAVRYIDNLLAQRG